MIKRQGIWQQLLAVSALAGLVAGCNPQVADDTQAAPTLPKVEVVTVKVQPLAPSSNLPGRVEPLRLAEVRARAAGIVLSRHFEEGAEVRAGQLLFQIDPAPYRAALARAEAALFEARTTVQRYQPLVEMKAVSRQDYDRAQAAQKTAEANVQTARLELDYATVTAPISGRIGRTLVTEGALVGQGEATPMATIQQIDPVYVDFRQPVAEALRWRAALMASEQERHQDQRTHISLTVDGVNLSREGTLLFSDITVDRSTGQVLLRGEFPNPDGLLLPGMYVRVHTGQNADASAILVPQRAVQRKGNGEAQVLVVGEGNVVEARPVRTGAMQGANWHIIDGLQVGERVIVGGRASAGTTVEVATSPAPTQPDSSPVTDPSPNG